MRAARRSYQNLLIARHFCEKESRRHTPAHDIIYEIIEIIVTLVDMGELVPYNVMRDLGRLKHFCRHFRLIRRRAIDSVPS